MTSIYTPTADEVKQRLRPFGLFFEKSLKDLIKGIRSHSKTPEQLCDFLTNVLSECREEVKNSDFNLKTNAILKLIYLEMYGFDMSWANFHVLEVMSSNKFQHKRVGYLAASQSFHKDSDILMLATNLLKKDLKYNVNNDTVRIGIALSGLSTIVTPELAHDICEDLFLMLSSSKPYIRKKAVTALFKVFLQYPEALRDNFDNFISRLEDDDLSVVSATVSVICELSKHNPHPFVQLSPILYQMLIKVDNNWVIIRLLKLFTNLSQVEPKLRVKILPNVLELMDSTSAISVVYESINCIVKGNMLESDDYDTAVACLDKLHDFCTSNDPNLRYISCALFYKIGKINTDFISNFDSLIIKLLQDVDVSIRSKTLELLEGIIDDDNIIDVVQILLKQLVDVDKIKIYEQEFNIEIPDTYKSKMIHTICKITAMNNYANIGDFKWYCILLFDLCVVSQDIHDKTLDPKLGEQIRNLMIKVPDMRIQTMDQIVKLMGKCDLIKQLPGVLKESLWSIGEYSSLLDDSKDFMHLLIQNTKYYNSAVQQIALPAILKIYSNWCNQSGGFDLEEVKTMTQELIVFMEFFITSKEFEVQERASEEFEFLRLCLDSLNEENCDSLPLLISEVLPSFFKLFELQPIIGGTQRKLQSNVDMDWNKPFLTEQELEEMMVVEDTYEDTPSEDNSENENEEFQSGIDANYDIAYKYESNMTTEEQEAIQERRRQERVENPFYLQDEEDPVKQQQSLLELSDRNASESKTSIVKLSTNSKLKGKRRKFKVRVISDAIIVGGSQDQEESSEHSERQSLSSSTHNVITLQTKNKLGSFDFSRLEDYKKESEAKGDIQKLRDKFARLELEGQRAEEPVEEVIVIKKKKKKSSKKSKDPSKIKKKKDSTNFDLN
ncbi:Apl5p Ecym_2217 [Eremothecium cymbalariae DBVPG|uniref:AP-3 complex subunit delta n=1 Tax=Eremothecium cymbalariae (strain CBS 270.75 / DBVPG 7215 / KCTC 17166 / NRRL Y-17582) TaxID=931890 RepID=G8JP61_ERECY|nr:Hypothetical protein Ecym_2217 [Eremothecium cymbalariae DBVPG\